MDVFRRGGGEGKPMILKVQLSFDRADDAGFGESALNFDSLVWTTKPNHQFIRKSDLSFRVFELLKERKIQVPFSQRDLHLRSGSLLSP